MRSIKTFVTFVALLGLCLSALSTSGCASQAPMRSAGYRFASMKRIRRPLKIC